MKKNPENLPQRVDWAETEPERYVSEPSPQGGLEEGAARGKGLMIRFVMTQGADANVISGVERWNVLQKGIFWNWPLKGLKMLARHVDDIDFRDRAGRTALHLAVHYNRPDAALMLLEKGADPWARTDKGIQPLSLAGEENFAEFQKIFERYTLKSQAFNTVRMAGISRRKFMRRSIHKD